MAEIGRLNSFGIGIETTPGTTVSADAWLPVEEASLKPSITNVKDESGFGIIDSFTDAYITQSMSEFSASGVMRSKTLGWLLYLALGTSASPTLVETGVYSHAFTRKNDNNHPTATIINDNTTQEKKAGYHMIDTVNFNFEVGSQAKFELTSMGQSIADDSGNSPTFVTGDEAFLVSKMCVKFANDTAGLTGATPVSVQSLSFEIAKNLTQIFGSASTCGTDAIEFQSQHNQNFDVTGDFEITYNNDTYFDLATALTNQAVQIEITGKSLIGATKYNTITFTFPKVILEDWDKANSNNEITSQSFGFQALYSIADTSTISATLINSVSAQYS